MTDMAYSYGKPTFIRKKVYFTENDSFNREK